MPAFDRDELIYDWNEGPDDSVPGAPEPMFVDETLRDGLQSPSVRDPDLDEKLRLVRLMDRRGRARARAHPRAVPRDERAHHPPQRGLPHTDLRHRAGGGPGAGARPPGR